jgi:uncharacterized membrane protein
MEIDMVELLAIVFFILLILLFVFVKKKKSDEQKKWIMLGKIERHIRRAASNTVYEYWSCDGDCDNCPSQILWANPDRYYGVDNCEIAARIDAAIVVNDIYEGNENKIEEWMKQHRPMDWEKEYAEK